MDRALPNLQSTLALLGILASGWLYAGLKTADSSFQESQEVGNPGLWWPTIWLVSFLLDMIYIKHIVEKFPCSSSERTLYQNFLALPMLVALLISGIERHNVFEATTAPLSAYMAVLFTCFAGAALSFTGMSLRTELSASLFTILGIVCKMASTLLNEAFIEPERDPLRLSCVAAVILSSSLYKQAPLRSDLAICRS